MTSANSERGAIRSMRKLPWKLLYRPRRVECPRCGVRVEEFPWAEPWARVTTALSNAVGGVIVRPNTARSRFGAGFGGVSTALN